jgi:hypothetical protein
MFVELAVKFRLWLISEIMSLCPPNVMQHSLYLKFTYYRFMSYVRASDLKMVSMVSFLYLFLWIEGLETPENSRQ